MFDKIKLVLFDFGGTIDTNGIHWSELFWAYYKKYNFPIEYEQFRKAYIATQKTLDGSKILENKTLRETVFKQLTLQKEYFQREFEFSIDDEALINICFEIYDFVKINAKKTIEIVQTIKYGKKFGIVSNFNGNLRIVCNDLGLSPYFDYFVDSAVVGIWKPDPKIFEIAIEHSGAKREETVIIGDSYSRDIEPAKSIGCNTIWLKKESWETPDDISAADLTIDSLEKLKYILS